MKSHGVLLLLRHRWGFSAVSQFRTLCRRGIYHHVHLDEASTDFIAMHDCTKQSLNLRSTQNLPLKVIK